MANVPAAPVAVPIIRAMLAETFGTFLLVFLGCGVVHTAVLTGAQSGLWQVAVVWGIGVTLAIYAVEAISGAHINPAITVAFAVWGKHPWARVIPYLVAQVAGAILAAALLYSLFAGFHAAKEREKGVVRGEPGSIVTAMCFGEYCPNPGSIATAPGNYDTVAHAESNARLTPDTAVLAEFVGAFMLACMVFALIDAKNQCRPMANLAPVFIGLTVAALISVLAPLTQACFNPARDLGPRLVAYFAGWGSVAFPGQHDLNWLTVYILSPIAGDITGGGFQYLVLSSSYRASGDCE